MYIYVFSFFRVTELPRKMEREREKRDRNSIYRLNLQMAAMSTLGQAKHRRSIQVSHKGSRGLKCLNHPLLASQTVSRELDPRWNSWDMNQCPYGMLVL